MQMNMNKELCIFWFRRDLRLEDNVALYYALTSGYPVLPIFVFDTNILRRFGYKQNGQVEFIFEQLSILKTELESYKSSLFVGHGTPVEIFEELLSRYEIKSVYANEDYELYSRERDVVIENKNKGIPLKLYKDQVIFGKNDILKEDGTPYSIFTPYSKKWKSSFNPQFLQPYNCTIHFRNFVRFEYPYFPKLSDLGYQSRGIVFPENTIDDTLILNYALHRNYPAIQGTSRLGVHLRFGTISIRMLVKKAYDLSDAFLNELIWREFYFAITWHYPYVNQGFSFKKKYDTIEWRNNETEFEAWCTGQTGYPFVDAGMRELNTTGFMHNRVRMIAASFLVKHLLIDWRWGEAYFANRLLDFDFSANNGGWQWAAGSGCDAAPYFRIFNPQLQSLKFDKDGTYIRKWVPEKDTSNYPIPIVEHNLAKKRSIDVYQQALKVE